MIHQRHILQSSGWEAHQRVMVHISIVGNGILSDKPFRGAVEYSKQIIKFCGIGSHHQNYIAERKIQNLTLEAVTLLLCTKHCCPEAITVMVWIYTLNAITKQLNNLKV